MNLLIMNQVARALVIVEDEELLRWYASELFSDAGYRVHEAATADAALQVLEGEPDLKLVFTDVTLPGSMDGTELAHHVARHWPHIAIIVVSGKPPPTKLPEGARFHAKPYDREAVLRHAREMIDRRAT